MALTVQVRSNDTGVPAVTFDAPRIVLGRGQSCDVRLPDPSVSRRHASIRQRGAEYVILDEGSANGTYVGRTKLAPGAPHVVHSGDIVRCGLVEVELKLETAAPPSPNAAQITREIALMLIEGALVSDGKRVAPFVVARGGLDDGKEFPLNEPSKAYVIGRGPQADFDLQDEDISRRHAELQRRGSEVWVRDLAAKNRTRLGNETLSSESAQRWNPKLTLQLSPLTTLELHDPLSETLLAIEAAPDEILDGLPPHQTAEAFPSTADVDAEHEAALSDERVPPNARITRPLPRASERRWTASDLLVGLLALVILACSVLGMLWLVRG